MKGAVLGTLALASVTVAATDVQAMPIQPLTSTAAVSNNLEHVWWRGGWGWRGGYGWRGGWGWRRPWGYYGVWRRPIYGYGYGWRRPYWGYGYRRW